MTAKIELQTARDQCDVKLKYGKGQHGQESTFCIRILSMTWYLIDKYRSAYIVWIFEIAQSLRPLFCCI